MTKYCTKLKIKMLQKIYNIDVVILVALIYIFYVIFYKKVTILKYVDGCIFFVFYLRVPINVV